MDRTDQEQAFSNKIDCNFPYSDVLVAGALVAESWSISPNAAFCVLYEILCPPASEDLSKQTRRELLAIWIKDAASPLAAPIADLASQVIDGGKLSTEQALAVMRKVAEMPGQYAALAVVSHLACVESEDVDCALVDALDQEIRMRWATSG